jgi:hypothetical protein
LMIVKMSSEPKGLLESKSRSCDTQISV